MFPFFKKSTSPISSFHVSGLKTEPIHYPSTLDETEIDGITSTIKYFFRHPEEANQERLDALWNNVKALQRPFKRYQIKEISDLYIAAAFFQDEELQRKASRKLYRQLKRKGTVEEKELRQTIESLLDCINIGERMGVNGAQIREYVKPMLVQLNTIPPLEKPSPIIPAAAQLNDYARRLYIKW